MKRIVLLLTLAILAAPALAGTRAWTIDDILATRTVSDPQISPDGRWVVYVVSELNDDKSEYQTDLWLVPAEGGEARRLTTSPQADENPRWSPDGKQIGFLSERPRPGTPKDRTESGDDEGRRQLWLIRPDGGEAWLLSNSKGGISSFEWSREGRTIAYLAREPKSDERRKKEKDKDDAWTPRDRYAWNRLWVLEVESRKATQLTSGDFHVTGFSFAPDGRQLAIAGQPTPLIPDNYSSDLYLVPASGGKLTPLVQRKGLDNAPDWSPDGRWIAFVSQDEKTSWYSNQYLCVVPAGGGTARNLTAVFDERVADPAWNPDSRSLTFQAAQRTASHLFRVALEGGGVEPLTSGPEMNTGLSQDASGSTAAFLRQDCERPAEVFRLRPATGETEQITRANPQVSELMAFPKERMAWKGADGLPIEGLLVYPAGYRKGQKVPLLVNVHGGPAGTHSNTWTAASRTYGYPLFAQKGYAILLPNPRGSGGYGAAFRAANVRDWGGKDYQDIMAGVDHVIAMGVADPGRLAICGWSYGGFMTSTVVTKTDRFRAAAVGAGVTDLFSMAMTCDIPEFTRDYFESWPWEDPTFYADHSAMVHANNVRTPTLIIHGEKDERVPTSQGWEFYNALRKVGVTTELLLLPRAPHGPREPKLLRSVMQWHFDWINRYTLAGAPAAGTSAAKDGAKVAGTEPR